MLKNYTKEYSVNIICLVTQLNIEVGLPGIETDLYLESQPEVKIATSFETTKELGGISHRKGKNTFYRENTQNFRSVYVLYIHIISY